MYHKENVDYSTLIWEDLQYQIENRQSKVRRREIMPYPRLKFISIEERHQVYGKPISDTLLIEDIRNSKVYKMFLGYFTGKIPPKKGRGKGHSVR
nr:hypothetical protein [Tanacetum cinerariifolium]